MFHFCTYFDHNYLSKGLALYRSLLSCCPSFTLHILTLSHECHERLSALNLQNVILYKLDDLEAFDFPLRECKATRSFVEYYFTLSPCFPRYLFATGDMQTLTYIDADCYFFSDPTDVINGLTKCSVGLVAHKFSERLREFEICGKFNVGWLTYNRCEETAKILDWWRARCIEWCFDRIEVDRFADQKYLDSVPVLYKNVYVLPHVGVNAAPWNIENYAINIEQKKVLLDGMPLVTYHFHGCKSLFHKFWQLGLSDYGVYAVRNHRELYKKYVSDLLLIEKEMSTGYKEKNRRGSFFSEDMLTKLKRMRKIIKHHDFILL